MKYLKAFKFRIYPNNAQRVLFAKTFGCVRFIYNKMLNDKIEYYKETKLSLNNTPAQYKRDFEWLKEVDSLSLANAQMNLQTAYTNFFRNPKIGFPKFKSKRNSKNTYTTNRCGNNIYLQDNHLRLPKLGFIKIRQHRELPENSTIKSVTISQSKTNKYFASILTEYDLEIPNKRLDTQNSIGLDYSSHDFYVDNFGNKPNYPKFYRIAQNKLAKEQRKLSRMQLHSHNFENQKIKVAKVSEKVQNCRLDFLHKLSTQLATTYDYVFVEDINMQGMSQCLTLGKSTMDNSFGKFRELLQYKMIERGTIFHKINKWVPTSQTCNVCGCKSTITKNLSIRKWICPACKTQLDRDINAAINIRNCGILDFA